MVDQIFKEYAPPPMLTVSEWADKYRYLSPEAAAEPGKWDTSRAEYLRGIMDAANDPDIDTVVFMKSSQVGGTECINNIIGYLISQDPCPILLVQPTETMAQTWSKDRFSPMIRDTHILTDVVKAPKTRDSNNTILNKSFPGGNIAIGGANSPAGLAGRPRRIIITDDIDRFPASAGTEGDPVDLAVKRSKTFWNRLVVLVSTPTLKGLSRIEAAWNESDQRKYFVPCPKCKREQILIWGQVKWQNSDPYTAKYECEKCKKLWTDAQRWDAIRQGKWKPTAESISRDIAGFHIWEAYSSWVQLSDMVADFYERKDNPERLKVFVNTSLGETWEEKGESIDENTIFTRREKYPAQVPAGGLVLVSGTDIQDDRIETGVIAFGEHEESWSIDHIVNYGDPAKPEVWNDLSNTLNNTYVHESGIKMKISCSCVDTGGHFTREAYKFCKGKEHRRIYAIKGSNTVGQPLISRPSRRNKGRVLLFMIGTDTAKNTIFRRLQIEEPGPSYMHFPIDKKHDEEYFLQLTAEKITTKYTRGFPHRVWVQIRARNEILDIWVYSLAALEILNPNYEAIKKSFKLKADQKKGETKKEVEPKTTTRRGKSSWVKGWK